MSDLERFIQRFDKFSDYDGKTQVDYFAFYLQDLMEQDSFTTKQILACFDDLSIKSYSRTSAYLSENSRDRKGKYIKSKQGYRLERRAYEQIKKDVEDEPERVQVSDQLSDLVANLKDSQEREFLREALNCFKVGANRATIILIWILVIEHLQKIIFNQELSEFNASLSKNPDKKVKKIVKYDDFSGLQETKFIEVCRSANIISNDVRKILAEKLGIRNSAAHPSSIVFKSHKTTEFALDLINNVLLKY